MNLLIVSCILSLFLSAHVTSALAQVEVFELSLKEAESQAIRSSNGLKAFVSDTESAFEQADSQYAALLPRLSLEGSYTYLSEVPNIPIPSPTPIPFGSHQVYSIGPVLRYTLWDTGASRKAYKGVSKMAEYRKESYKNQELQLLLAVRSSYIRVELALTELLLVNDSLELSRAEGRDVVVRFRAGAASRLDTVISQREILNYQLQFKQKQSELSAALVDLQAFLGARKVKDISHPGPPDLEGVTLVLRLQPLKNLISEEEKAEIPPPDDLQPQIRSQDLLAESALSLAESHKAEIYPSIQLSAKTSLDYPDGPVLERVNQNTISLSLSMPLFEGDRTKHLAAEKIKEAESAKNRRAQIWVDIHRDFDKSREVFENLREQQAIAGEDVAQSEKAAKLYYESYKAGKINLTDVQSANLQALQAKVNAARIDAQILNQLFILKALSGKEAGRE
jgi:outer membrane protein TolC